MLKISFTITVCELLNVSKQLRNIKSPYREDKYGPLVHEASKVYSV